MLTDMHLREGHYIGTASGRAYVNESHVGTASEPDIMIGAKYAGGKECSISVMGHAYYRLPEPLII